MRTNTTDVLHVYREWSYNELERTEHRQRRREVGKYMNGLLSPKETAMRLGIPPGRCRKWIARGTLPSTRDGGRIYIPAKAVDRLLERIASGELPHLD